MDLRNVSYRQPEKFEALSQEAAGSGAALTGYAVDVTLAKVLAEHGRLDALVNTVGGFAGGQKLPTQLRKRRHSL